MDDLIIYLPREMPHHTRKLIPFIYLFTIIVLCLSLYSLFFFNKFNPIELLLALFFILLTVYFFAFKAVGYIKGSSNRGNIIYVNGRYITVFNDREKAGFLDLESMKSIFICRTDVGFDGLGSFPSYGLVMIGKNSESATIIIDGYDKAYIYCLTEILDDYLPIHVEDKEDQFLPFLLDANSLMTK